jgi:hypothetical protein
MGFVPNDNERAVVALPAERLGGSQPREGRADDDDGISRAWH